MYRDAIEWKKDHYLAPGSEAFELYKEWKKNPHQKQLKSGPLTPHNKLLALLEETDRAWRKLEGRP